MNIYKAREASYFSISIYYAFTLHTVVIFMNLKFGNNYVFFLKQQYHNTMINSRNDCRILKRNSLNIIDI